MVSSSISDVAYDFSPMFIVYKDGYVKRLIGCDVVPPSYDPETHVESKDVVISKADEDISARIYLPKLKDPNEKLPLLVYFHGGGFCIGTPSSIPTHNFLNSIVSKAHVVGVSVHYRRAPEHRLPIAFEDSWTALEWVASHSNGEGPDEWLNRHADFKKVFFSGESSGATITEQVGIRVGTDGLAGLNLEGIALVHPYFWGAKRIGSEAKYPEGVAYMEKLWRFACPTTTGSDDPLINPTKDPNLRRLGCKRVLLCVAENDLLKERGLYYKATLEKSGWNGVVEVTEAKGEGHTFHLINPDCENAHLLLNRIASFFNHT